MHKFRESLSDDGSHKVTPGGIVQGISVEADLVLSFRLREDHVYWMIEESYTYSTSS